jgi:hypothetical protein
MTAVAHRPAAVAIQVLGERASVRAGSPDRLRLLPTGDGWSLVGPEGEVVFQALGVASRRKCLEFARDHGVLAVFT